MEDNTQKDLLSPRTRLDSGCVLENLNEETLPSPLTLSESLGDMKLGHGLAEPNIASPDPLSAEDEELLNPENLGIQGLQENWEDSDWDDETSTGQLDAELLDNSEATATNFSEGSDINKTQTVSAGSHHEFHPSQTVRDGGVLSSFANSISTSLNLNRPNHPLPKLAAKPRYTRIGNPNGHRIYQKWLKTTAIAKLVQDAKAQVVKGSKAVTILKNPTVHIKPVPEKKIPEAVEVSKRHISQFGHGRWSKVVYKGPICYNCSGKHHVRDCGARLLKGKKARKAAAA